MKRLFPILVLLLLVACTVSEDELPVAEREQGPVLFGMADGQGGVEWVNGRSTTRAEAGDVESETPRNIGVFAFGDGQNTTYIFKNRKVYYLESQDYNYKFGWEYSAHSSWPYTEDVDEKISVQKPWEKMRYKFFAYSPWHPTGHVKAEAENYAGFNTFTWDNIPGFSADDYMLANEIVDLDNTAGEFTTTGNIVHFRMRHILSRIRFFFKMSPDYRKIRKIQLNSLTILTAGKVKTATFNFKNNEWDETVQWSNEQSGDADPVELANISPDDYMIPTAYPEEPFQSVYVYPQTEFKELKMRISYTVYDSEGLVTRQAKVTNAVSLLNWTLLSGYYYDIKINVVPDYLYVLSDNDQDFDGYIVIKDG